MAADLEKIVDELSTLSVLEAAELVSLLEEKWGVSAAAPVAAAAAAAPAEAVEEKTEFDVVIKETGPKKIDVIKAIRQLTSLGLKESKELAETAGSKILTQVGKEAAADAKGKLEAAGAVIEVAQFFKRFLVKQKAALLEPLFSFKELALDYSFINSADDHYYFSFYF